MNQTFQQRLAHQIEVVFRSGSTYVVLGFGAFAALVAGLSTDAIASLTASVPFLKPYPAIISAIAIYFATRLKPSGAVSTQTQAFIDEITRLRLNVALKAAGQPEIPAPPAAAALPVSVPPAVLPDITLPPAVIEPPPPPPVDPLIELLRQFDPTMSDDTAVAMVKAYRSGRPARERSNLDVAL